MSAVIAELLRRNILTVQQLSSLREKSSTAQKPVQDLLIELGYLKEEELFDAVRKVFPVATVDLDEADIDLELVHLIPAGRVRCHGIFPIQKDGDSLVVAMSDPCDFGARDEIGFITNLHVRPVLCGRRQISQYIERYYKSEDTVQEILKDTMDDTRVEFINEERLTSEEIIDLAKYKADNSSFVRLVNKVISDAVQGRASDVHIEPQEKAVEVRYRIDGYLKSIVKIPMELHPRLAARIKILAKLDIAEQRKTQEGRIKTLINGQKIDLRISVIPVFYGEKIVLRILDSRSAQFDLNKIGFESDELEIFKSAVGKTQGVVLVTGPTGSGKTTTLYAALQHIKCETKNIVTIEDPIEYLIEGINQLQLSRSKEVTFTSGLKSILRQDPDVILVGEIRDRETAEIAFRASLTGHLVFSTLHTNNAVSSVTRLLNIGLEPYLISSSLVLLVAQRLVRVICPHCREEYLPDAEVLLKFRSYLNHIRIKRFSKGRGCERCNFSGFHGRTSIFEILRIDEKVKNLIFHRASESMILKEAAAGGMRTLVESGFMKVAAGLTTLEEVAKVTDVMEQKQNPVDLLTMPIDRPSVSADPFAIN